MNLLKSKKAQGQNYLAAIIFLVIFGFFNILAYVIFNSFLTSIAATGLYDNNSQAVATGFLTAIQAYDYLIIFLAIIFVVSIGLTSFFIATSRIFFLITVVLGIFWAFVAYFFNYIFAQLVEPAIFAVAKGVFPRTLLLLSNLHWLALLFIIVGSLTLYAKRERGQFT